MLEHMCDALKAGGVGHVDVASEISPVGDVVPRRGAIGRMRRGVSQRGEEGPLRIAPSTISREELTRVPEECRGGDSLSRGLWYPLPEDEMRRHLESRGCKVIDLTLKKGHPAMQVGMLVHSVVFQKGGGGER